MMRQNGLAADDVVSILFTATEDLTSAFPAEAIREVGLRTVPVLCAREVAVAGAMTRVVRVLMHVEREAPEVTHVYLGETRSLRDDLP